MFVWITLIVLKFIVKSDAFSEQENRYLAKLPTFTLEKLFNGTYQEELDTYINDHFIFRNAWIKIKSESEILLGKDENNGVYIGKDGYLFEKFEYKENEKEHLEKVANTINQFIGNTELPTYFMLIPNSIYINQDKLPDNVTTYNQNDIINNFYSKLDGKIKTINVTDTQSQIKTIKIANGEQNTDYFENEGNSLQMITDDKSAEAAVRITKNGIYTIYAEDEQGNKTVKVITITEIVTPDPDDTITSSVYVITTTMIDKISPNTDVNTFKNNISTEVGYTIVNAKGEELQNTQEIGTGYKLITETNKEYTLIVTGDLTGDGNITLIDMSLLRKHYLEIESLQDEYLKAADMDNNNIISLRDIANMRKTILEIDE